MLDALGFLLLMVLLFLEDRADDGAILLLDDATAADPNTRSYKLGALALNFLEKNEDAFNDDL